MAYMSQAALLLELCLGDGCSPAGGGRSQGSLGELTEDVVDGAVGEVCREGLDGEDGLVGQVGQRVARQEPLVHRAGGQGHGMAWGGQGLVKR